LLALNIADDYFKAKKQGALLENDVLQKDKEMYDLKHELISTQINCENLEQEIERLKMENQQMQMQIVKLETEIQNQPK
jgi:cell division protein ZapA